MWCPWEEVLSAIPRALWVCKNGFLNLWVSAAFCRMCILRTVHSAERFYLQSNTPCVLFLVFLLCCTRPAVRWHKCDTKPLLHIPSVKLTDADTRKFKELMKKWRLQVIASFSDFFSVHGPFCVQRSELKYGSTGCNLASVICEPGRHE